MRLIISMILPVLLGGCADLGYYWHSASGHLALMSQRVDIGEMLEDPALDSSLRGRLQLVREIRRFSIERLDLPANGSYTNYVDLDRPYVLQNLFAAAEFSTRLHTWCYPVIGCTSYRGFFDGARLAEFADGLEQQGFEVYVSQVAAYSTLGWFDDPVLSSFIEWPDYRLAGLLFHELTHQQLYIDDDSTFNESLASAVQQVGTVLWLESRDRRDEIERFDRWLDYRREVVTLIVDTRDRLSAIYARAIGDDEKRMHKARVFSEARDAHGEIARRHGIEGGFTRWFAEGLNNAKLGSVSTYNAYVGAFVDMIRAHDNAFGAFFAYASRVGALDPATRERCLQAWSDGSPGAEPACPAIG